MKISTHNNPVARLVSVATIGVVVVVGMFAMLYRLVDVPLNTGPLHKPLPMDFSPVYVPPPVVKPPRPVKPEPEQPSEVTSITTLVKGDPTEIEEPGPYTGLTIDPIDPRRGIEGNGGIQVSGNDRDVTVLVQIPPLYPPSAETRGIEGWVRVQFTITETGSVRDARVVAADPVGVFDEAALTAIGRWRYSPRFVNGASVERVGVQTQIEFQLTE